MLTNITASLKDTITNESTTKGGPIPNISTTNTAKKEVSSTHTPPVPLVPATEGNIGLRDQVSLPCPDTSLALPAYIAHAIQLAVTQEHQQPPKEIDAGEFSR